MAVERLKSCDNIVALSEELGVHRRLLYPWRDRSDAVEGDEESPPGNSRESTLRQEISQLQRVVAEKTLGVGFFQRCLAKSRGSTPAERYNWRDGVYDEIQEVRPLTAGPALVLKLGCPILDEFQGWGFRPFFS
jgi:hypothetical protein